MTPEERAKRAIAEIGKQYAWSAERGFADYFPRVIATIADEIRQAVAELVAAGLPNVEIPARSAHCDLPATRRGALPPWADGRAAMTLRAEALQVIRNLGIDWPSEAEVADLLAFAARAVDAELARLEEWANERDDWRRCRALYAGEAGWGAFTEAAWAFGLTAGEIAGEIARRRAELNR